MDKLVGTMLYKNLLPLKEHIVLFSGRLGYELVQKSLTAGIPVVCAIGAPSSLAVETCSKEWHDGHRIPKKQELQHLLWCRTNYSVVNL
jgi:FdhD protein